MTAIIHAKALYLTTTSGTWRSPMHDAVRRTCTVSQLRRSVFSSASLHKRFVEMNKQRSRNPMWAIEELNTPQPSNQAIPSCKFGVLTCQPAGLLRRVPVSPRSPRPRIPSLSDRVPKLHNLDRHKVGLCRFINHT
jgi:hypothetical protein